MNRCAVTTLAMLLALAGLCVADTPSWTGYRGPGGNGIFPDAKPPTTFTEEDVAWRVTLPDKGWGHSSPIVVGDLVILAVEFNEHHNIFPSLIAFNTTDGSVAWSTLLDHLPAVAVSDEERKKIRAAWQKINDWVVARKELQARLSRAKTDEEKETLTAEANAAGFDVVLGKKSWNRGKPVLKNRRKLLDAEWRQARKGGFSWATWRSYKMSSTWNIGYAFATPVTDGKHIWMHTSFNGFFCVDLEGKIIWRAYVPGLVKYSNNALDYCKAGRSPILWDDPAGGPKLLLSDVGDTVRAISAATGEVLWKDDIDHKKNHTYVSPVVLRVNGTEILWSANCNAYRLPDGKKLTVQGWKEYGTMALVKHDERDVLFLCGRGEHSGWSGKGSGKSSGHPSPAAVRWALEGDTLKAEVLWDAKTLGANGAMGGPSMLYHDGKFYHNNYAIYDALTGKVLIGKPGTKKTPLQQRKLPQTRHLRLLANGHVYGLDSDFRSKGPKTLKMSVHKADGTYVGTSTISGVSYGSPFTFGGNAIYLRAVHELIKIGE